VTILPESNLARAVYRIRPVSPEGEVVEVVEEYRMSQEGALLIGTVRVSAIGDAGPGGSYVLHRRFEREP
ncbi:MAG TPA: hypothetical protein VGR38_05320, partial [Candidatus Polarisedimenticolia bacterium]|nr:hypothetical protein [Candidatus Polarisedimenticolia bacterium]